MTRSALHEQELRDIAERERVLCQAAYDRPGVSSVDMSMAEVRRAAARIYDHVAAGGSLEDAIAKEDKDWRAFAAKRAKQVNGAVKTRWGPYSGQSAARHMWVSPDEIQQIAPQVRGMVARVLATEHAPDVVARHASWKAGEARERAALHLAEVAQSAAEQSETAASAKEAAKAYAEAVRALREAPPRHPKGTAEHAKEVALTERVAVWHEGRAESWAEAEKLRAIAVSRKAAAEKRKARKAEKPPARGLAPGARDRADRANDPQTASDWAERMAALRDVKPRPLKKRYGSRPTPEQAAQHADDERAWNREYRAASARQKEALERENAAFFSAARAAPVDVEEEEPPTLRRPPRLPPIPPGFPGLPAGFAAPAPPAHLARIRKSEAGFARLEPLVFVAGGAVGFAAAPRLNARITIRPLGQYVPPSAAASVVALLGAGLARRYGQRKTAVAALGLGLGLAAGTITSAKQPGGLLSGRA